MSKSEYLSIVESARQKFNAGDMEGYLTTLYDSNAALHYLPPGLPPGLAGARLFYAGFAAAFPDAQLSFDDVISEGDKVAVRYYVAMTHQGEFQGIPPTGKHLTLPGITILRFGDGKVVERWNEADFMGLLQQMGAIPQP
ncbi:MAG: ester cyclase [Ardenticatenaceae bacterium]|nr:ester cyclase [Ardenticatenaceae bacterium]HBY97986.1 ester cyclase [Chloroflexota bacterium]